MLSKLLVAVLGAGALGLAIAPSGHAAGTHLGPGLLAVPLESEVIQVQSPSGSAGPGRVGPGRVGPGRVGPGRAGPGRAGPGSAGPGRVGPGRAAPGRVGPGRVGPGRAGPGRVGPGRVGPGRVGPGRASPGRPGVWRWSRDRRHRFYGAFFGVPFGTALYGSHYCYDWRAGPRGWGYYWNYGRCPI